MAKENQVGETWYLGECVGEGEIERNMVLVEEMLASKLSQGEYRLCRGDFVS